MAKTIYLTRASGERMGPYTVDGTSFVKVHADWSIPESLLKTLGFTIEEVKETKHPLYYKVMRACMLAWEMASPPSMLRDSKDKYIEKITNEVFKEEIKEPLVFECTCNWAGLNSVTAYSSASFPENNAALYSKRVRVRVEEIIE